MKLILLSDASGHSLLLHKSVVGLLSSIGWFPSVIGRSSSAVVRGVRGVVVSALAWSHRSEGGGDVHRTTLRHASIHLRFREIHSQRCETNAIAESWSTANAGLSNKEHTRAETSHNGLHLCSCVRRYLQTNQHWFRQSTFLTLSQN